MARGVCIGGGEARSLGFFHGQGGKVVERSAVSLHQNSGRNGGLVHGARGRKERRGRTQRCGHDVWRRGPVGVVHELGRRSLRVWAGHVGLARRAVPLFIYSKKFKLI
jgi:hypothetical protein